MLKVQCQVLVWTSHSPLTLNMVERHKRDKLNPRRWRKRGESEFTPITVTWVCR